MAEIIKPTDQKPWGLLDRFDYKTLPAELATLALPFHDLAHDMDIFLPEGNRRDTLLRKMLEIRNEAVRILWEENEKAIKDKKT